MPKKYFFTAAVLSVLFLSGCSLLALGDKASSDWKSTDYTVEQIEEMGVDSPENCRLGDESDDDCTKEALKAYNVMLGYAENVADFEYKVYDFYYAEYTEHYVIKIVPKDRAKLAENGGYTLCDEEILMLSCNENATAVQSGIETYLMSRRWTQELKEAMSESFPEYHFNTQYVSLDYIVPNVKTESITDRSDYTYFFKDDFYSSITRSSVTFYGNIVNVIVPTDIEKEKAQEIFADIEPILREYCVTEAEIISPKNDEVFKKWQEDETVSGNYYTYKGDDELNWIEFFSITN